MNKRPIAVDLFAGAGGLSLGLEQAGFDVVAAVEIDPIHCCVHKFNFPNCAVLPQPIESISGETIRKKAGIAPDEVIDLVAGGAPCQGFSLIGQRALDDPRNNLVKEYIRIVKELQPSYFLFENVKGLTVGKHKKFLDEIIYELQALNYEVHIPWKVLNAKDFGVPQSRERLFLIGAKRGLTLPDYPSELNEKMVSCYDALADIPDAEIFDELLETDEVFFEYLNISSNYAALMRCDNEEGWRYGYKRNWNRKLLTSSLRTDHTEISRRRFLGATPGSVEKISRFFKLSADGVSNTLRAGTDSARGAFTSPRPIHYEYPRCITVREMARLHGFPDWFRFHETKWHGARQVGNSVPPPLAYALGQSFINALGVIIKPPTKCLNLSDDNLLRFDATNASRYWEIRNPIAKRDRKSGVTKRKQSEIDNLEVTVGNDQAQ